QVVAVATAKEGVSLVRILKLQRRELLAGPSPRPMNDLLTRQASGLDLRPGGQGTIGVQRKNGTIAALTTNTVNDSRVEGAGEDRGQLDVGGQADVAQHVRGQLPLRAMAAAVLKAIRLGIVALTRQRDAHAALGDQQAHDEGVLPGLTAAR